ncbi:S8 family serine peptidase [Runella zeae]|uniref:S8 family serine peptidase n=1 Tax=Runella zeae TaxID=94255 RepID=UPI00235729AC|nr:S8 family serine peptidase [Runella zeae]
METQNYILLPPRGTQTNEGTLLSFFLNINADRDNGILHSLSSKNIVVDSSTPLVLDSLHENGAKLVQMDEAMLVALRAAQPSLRIIPEIFYYPQRSIFRLKESISSLLKATDFSSQFRFRVVSPTDVPISGAQVIVVTNLAAQQGKAGVTNANGEIRFTLPSPITLERIYVYPQQGFWSLMQKNITLNSLSNTLKLRPLKLDFIDNLRHFYPNTTLTDGQNVTVGIIDSGCGPHSDLMIDGGWNAVLGQDENNFSDIDQHGTHVAGIVAGRGTAPTGVRGVAPGVRLRAYQVFKTTPSGLGASNFDIAKAIERAVADGCDIINMSLGSDNPQDNDILVEDEILAAHEKGVICFVATGNGGRAPVSIPANFSLSRGVGAMGRKGTFPTNSTASDNIQSPFGNDAKNFVAAFSNIGSEVDFIAPGVDVISCVPGGYAAMSGTSMACPAAVGIAAKLLATQPQLLALPRDINRSEAIMTFLATHTNSLGFGPLFEGLGLIQ